MSISHSERIAVAGNYFDGRSAKAHPVTLTLNDGVLHVRGETLERDEPIAALRVSEPMGMAPRLVSFPDGAHCEVRDHDGMARLLAVTGFEDSLVVRLQQRWRWALAAIVVTLAVVFAGYQWGLPAASEWLAFKTPDAVLARMGSSTLDVLDRVAFEPSKLSETRQQTLRGAFERLAAPADSTATAKARFTLLFRDGGAAGANAMALPDGTIVVTDQLVALAKHDDEIVAVLTHELGHVQRRHGLRMLIQSSIVAFVVTFYMGDVSSVAAGLPTLLLQARYSRHHEIEADAFGAAMLKANGISPRRLGDMLAKLEAAHRAKSGKPSPDNPNAEITPKNGDAARPAQRGGISDYLASHPATRERIEALNNAQ
jgi:Zn-dependent protease with chaperone function